MSRQRALTFAILLLPTTVLFGRNRRMWLSLRLLGTAVLIVSHPESCRNRFWTRVFLNLL